MKVFPVNETRKIRQLATVFPIFSAVGLKQLDSCVSFIVVFRLSDIVVQFFLALVLSRRLVFLVCLFTPQSILKVPPIMSVFVFHLYNCFKYHLA